MKLLLLPALAVSLLGQATAQDYQSGVFALPVRNATLLKTPEAASTLIGLLRDSGTGDCSSAPETYKLNAPKIYKIGELTNMHNRFVADAAIKKFKYIHINTFSQTKPNGKYTFTLFRLTGPQGSLFGHAVEFRGNVATPVPDVTTFSAATVLTICQAK